MTLEFQQAGQEADRVLFSPSELMWVKVSDVLPWAKWDFELFGEAAWLGIEFYAPDRRIATYASGSPVPKWRQWIYYRVFRRFLPHPYSLPIIILRQDLALWYQAAHAAGLVLEVQDKPVLPGEYGAVKLVERAGRKLEWSE